MVNDGVDAPSTSDGVDFSYLAFSHLRSGEGRANAVESPGRTIKGPSREAPSSEGEAVS